MVKHRNFFASQALVSCDIIFNTRDDSGLVEHVRRREHKLRIHCFIGVGRSDQVNVAALERLNQRGAVWKAVYLDPDFEKLPK
ncbi:hypothetical protein D3C80_1125430 [compost metagenome]